jgi:HAD superfamily hydrolase (TIGR01450 family)
LLVRPGRCYTPASPRTRSCATPVSPAHRPLDSYQAYLFDVDGTILYPERAIPGAAEALQALKQAGKRVLIVTNNSTTSRAGIVERLGRFGFPIEPGDVATAVVATARFISQERPGATVHVLGSQGLREELLLAGLQVVDGAAGAEYLAVGCDPQVTYARLTSGVQAAVAGARIVAVNLDGLIFDPHGSFPGGGTFVGAIQGASGRAPDVVVGKPSPLLLQETIGMLGLPAQECLFVGDSLAADVLAARAVGMPSVLVLSGVTRADQVPNGSDRPEYVLESVAELGEAVRRGQRRAGTAETKGSAP